MSDVVDHERIWLEPMSPDGRWGCEGRLWCQDKVWPEMEGDPEPTEYVRADIAAAEITALRDKLAQMRVNLDVADETIVSLREDLASAIKERDEAREFIAKLVNMQSGEGWSRSVIREAAANFLYARGVKIPHGPDSTPEIRAEAAEARALAAEAKSGRLRLALEGARDAITHEVNSRSIACTVWMPVGSETMVDYIDAALTKEQTP